VTYKELREPKQLFILFCRVWYNGNTMASDSGLQNDGEDDLDLGGTVVVVVVLAELVIDAKGDV
jgi:hypothetical protein